MQWRETTPATILGKLSYVIVQQDHQDTAAQWYKTMTETEKTPIPTSENKARNT